MITINLNGQAIDYTQYVSPFIGTDAHGHTFPGATFPHGLVQLSPDTRLDGWDGCSGYHFSDSIIYGFSHTHLSGTGVSDYGDILIMPVVGEVEIANYGYQSIFDKTTEEARPGYYSVFLEDCKTLAEMTVTPYAGMHRYTQKDGDEISIVIDLAHRDKVLTSSLRQNGMSSFSGHRRSEAWAGDQHIYFHIECSQPIQTIDYYVNDIHVDSLADVVHDAGIKAIVKFESDNQINPLLIKIGLSAVDTEGAKNNLYNDIHNWDFDNIYKDTKSQWNKSLSRIEVESEHDDHLKIFYSALYHCFIAPNIWSDMDGRYRGIDGNIHQLDNEYRQYTIFSLWDTYRTLHPLMIIIDEKRTLEFIHSFLRHYKEGGLLPVWELAANETFCMIGYHSVSVIVDAWMKGIRDFDPDLALEAMIHSANQNHFGLKEYRQYGYIGSDMDHESVSKTLEYAYDDWCIAVFAKDIGRVDVYEEFIQRAQYYKNIFDASTGFMRPRVNGGWKSSFDPTEVDFNFTEANGWQYGFYVPHDIATMIQLHGGHEAFEKKLDELFETDLSLSGRHQVDITGLIGQYAHGNEPSHHMAYLYNFVNKPHKTQKRVKQILLEQYSVDPDGLSGNEDCGQMSAWYVMSAMGFYPVTPGSDRYVIGYPLFDKVTIHLENGQTFIINKYDEVGEESFIAEIKLNGEEISSSLHHKSIVEGGILNIQMSDTLNTSSLFIKDAPRSNIETNTIAVIPSIAPVYPVFKDSMEIVIQQLYIEDSLAYRLNNGEWKSYTTPFVIYDNSKVEAKTINSVGNESFIVVAEYVRLSNNYKIDVISSPHPQYSGRGPSDLVDGIRGAKNWRLGHWLGYFGKDFEAVVDLNEVKVINSIGAGFAQDVKSWIWMPPEVSFSVSKDGEIFNEIGTVLTTVPEDEYGYIISDFTIQKDIEARYIKVIAKNYGKIPDWHLGKGNDTYIFVDEIWIE